MCKYCEDPKVLNSLINCGIDMDGVYIGCSRSEIPESEQFDCCPKCGKSLRGAIPLTLEELRKMGGKAYYHVSLQKKENKWIILDTLIARNIQDYHYGEYWLAYDREI